MQGDCYLNEELLGGSSRDIGQCDGGGERQDFLDLDLGPDDLHLGD